MKEQDYLDHVVGVFGHPVAENPGVDSKGKRVVVLGSGGAA